MDQTVRRVMSGEARGVGATLLRGAMRLLESIYAAVMSSRNASYRRGVLRMHRCARPVVSVGNITTGGTGKTPVVRWLAEHLRQRGLQPAILMRGYRREPDAATSDEQQLLLDQLNPPGATGAPIVVHADPDRVGGAEHVLRDNADVDVFILDDGFQHRRLHRDFDLVLIDATNPFGFDHVLPRGLLREPLHGLSRASAVLITRADQALPGTLEEIGRTVRRYATSIPIYQSTHAQTSVVTDGTSTPIDSLRGKRIFAFCGVGNPEAFLAQLRAAGAELVATRSFGDHHAYEERDVEDLVSQAMRSGAGALVTTEKDWVKLARLKASRTDSVPIWRVRLELRFVADDEQKLFDDITRAIERSIATAPS